MINRMIDEINIALNSRLYLTALTSALTLPDVCGKVEFPDKKTGDRYKSWFTKYVTNGNISAEDVYALRCSLLHEGNTTPNDKTGNHFQLMVNSLAEGLGIDFCFNSTVKHADGPSDKEIDVYVGFLCTVICNAVKEYYRANKDKFSFLNYKIVDLASMFGFKEDKI